MEAFDVVIAVIYALFLLIFFFVVIAVTAKALSAVGEEGRRAREEAQRREAEARRQEKEARQRAATEAEMQKLLKFGLTCPRCDHLALPIPETGNRYHCPDCRFQFAGDAHGF